MIIIIKCAMYVAVLPDDIEIETQDEEISQEEREIVDNITNIMKERHAVAVKRFKKVDRIELNEVMRKVNNALKYNNTKTISDTNRLINSVAIYIGQRMGLKMNENKKHQEREP